MHAHFERHVYHRHSHDAYSFGVTETGAQAFACRGASRVSAAGMVMAFNPDDPHDGHAADEFGFTYRIVHLGPELIDDALADTAGRAVGRPLFADPVLADPVLAAALRRLHAALLPDDGVPTATPLRRAELLDTAVRQVVSRGATGAPADPSGGTGRAVADAARRYLNDTYLTGLDTADLAAAVGASRFAIYRAFRAAYGMSPSDYQRLLRLRYARRLLAAGTPAASAAARAGFADQAHLTRWFRRCYAITPLTYAAAG